MAVSCLNSFFQLSFKIIVKVYFKIDPPFLLLMPAVTPSPSSKRFCAWCGCGGGVTGPNPPIGGGIRGCCPGGAEAPVPGRQCR